MKVTFHETGTIDDSNLKFAVIAANIHGKWLLVKHRERNTWEIPGGHREVGEEIGATASRELNEETGANKFSLTAICEYCVNDASFGRLYLADIQELGELPQLEIAEVQLFDNLPENLTYPSIQPYLFNKVIEFNSSAN